MAKILRFGALLTGTIFSFGFTPLKELTAPFSFQDTTVLQVAPEVLRALPICGNGVTENPPEGCDNGMQCEDGASCKSDTDCKPTSLFGPILPGTCAPRSGDGCSAECRIEVTAITMVHAEYKPPEPQPTMQVNNQLYAEMKPFSLCGNGVKEDGESCDDGNTADGDGCSSGCLMELQRLPLKQEIQVYPEKTPYTAAPLKQEYNLAVSHCGNGTTEVDLGERCDDGNLVDGDGCNSKCQLELKAVYGAPVPVRETATVPAKVYVPETPPDPCLSAGPVGSPEYQCCKTYLYPEATLAVAALATAGPSEEAKKTYECCVKNGGAIPAKPGFDAATCSYLKPECKVSGPGTATQGEKVDFTVTGYLPFDSYECKESPAPPPGGEATAVLVSQGDYSDASFAIRSGDTQTVYASRSYDAANRISAAPKVYSTTADSDKTISCTVTGPGGTSDPCVTTVRVGACAFSCEQTDGVRSTFVGLDVDCKLLTSPAGSTCGVSRNGTAEVPIPGDGLVPVPTDDSGVQSFDVVCQGANFKAVCGDKIEITPVCEGINVAINGIDGTGLTAHEGDSLRVTVASKGAKQCTILVNGNKMAAAADGSAEFKVQGQGEILIDAVCLGGPDLLGNSQLTDCEARKVPVASPSCGNKVLETEETCDDGNGDATDACVNCQPAVCGDGFAQKGAEECDFGAKNDDMGSECTKKCRLPACGDTFLQKGIGETCDDGNLDVNDGCSSACAVEKCGDGIRQAKETCDPGIKYEGQPCKADCSGFEPPPPEPEPKPEETPPPPEEPAPMLMKKEEAPPPEITAIPWVGKKETESFAIVSQQPPVNEMPPPPPPPPEEDACLKEYPDVNSQGYKCCKEYKASQTDYFECCMAPENTDGVLDRAELQACECKSNPDEPLCNCLGSHQAEFLNGCLAASGSADKFTFKPEPPSYVYETATKYSRRPISMPACACAAPQPFKAPEGACGIVGGKKDLSVHDYPCLYPEQVAVYAAEPVPEGYRVTAPMFSDECLKLGGSAVSKDPPMAVAASSFRDQIQRELVVTEIDNEEVICTFVKPACPCTPPPPPPPPPETQPEPETEPEEPPPPPPPPPSPTTPEAKVTPQFRIAISSWGDFHAVLLDTGEEIALKEATPELPRLAITTDGAFRLYKAVSAYNKDPNAENLAKLRGIVNENLLGEVKDVPHYGLMLLTPPSKDREDEGASATPADFASVRAQFVNKAIELNTADGTLKVNTPEALQVFRPASAALEVEGEPEIVSMSQLFKTSFAAGERPPVIEFTVDAAQIGGGGEGPSCALTARESSQNPWLPGWTMLVATLTLMAWRFRTSKRRASTGSFTNTHAKASSTKH